MRSKIMIGLALGVCTLAGTYDVRADDDRKGKVNFDRKDSKVNLDRKDGARVGEVGKDEHKNHAGKGVIGTVTETTSTKDMMGMLDKFEARLNKMESVANKTDKDARKDVIDDIKDMREKMFDAKERVRDMERAKPEKVKELREDVRNAFEDLEKDYVEARSSLKGNDKDLF